MLFELGKTYTRDEIHAILGGNKETFLPVRNGNVLYGAFRRDVNPGAPDVVLPGFGPKIQQSAELFARQSHPIPIFIKQASKSWKYVGRYRVRRPVSRCERDRAVRGEGGAT